MTKEKITFSFWQRELLIMPVEWGKIFTSKSFYCGAVSSVGCRVLVLHHAPCLTGSGNSQEEEGMAGRWAVFGGDRAHANVSFALLSGVLTD